MWIGIVFVSMMMSSFIAISMDVDSDSSAGTAVFWGFTILFIVGWVVLAKTIDRLNEIDIGDNGEK